MHIACRVTLWRKDSNRYHACSARWPCPVDISSITIRLIVPIRWYTAGRPHAPMEPTVATATVSVRHTRYLDSLYERLRDVHSDARRAY